MSRLLLCRPGFGLIEQFWLECAINVFLISLLIFELLEFLSVYFTSLFCHKIEGLRDGCMWLWRIVLSSDWEELAGFRVFDITLVGVNCEFVIQTKDFSLTKQYLGLFFLLKFSELEHAAKTFDFYVISRCWWGIFHDFWSKCAILLICKLFISSLLSDTCHFGFLLGFEILRELLAILRCIFRWLFYVLFLPSEVNFRLECTSFILLLLVFLP